MFRVFVACAVLLVASSVVSASTMAFDDPLSGDQWYLGHMNFGEAWRTIFDSSKRGQIRVAVIDTGFDLRHDDLQRNVIRGFNIVNGRRNVRPVHPHGTATIAPLAAASGNAMGISRAAWTSTVLPIRVTNRPDGRAFVSDIAAAIRYAADHLARVINISYGGVNLKVLNDAARYAAKRGSVVFMAAGNDGLYHPGWKNHRWLIAVGSVREDGQVSTFSSRGGFVDFVAPGEDFISLYPGDQYVSQDGTSFASPMAASAAAVMLAVNPRLAPAQIIRLLQRTAVDLGEPGRDPESGYGLINVAEAVRLAGITEGKWTKRRAGRKIRMIDNDWSDFRGILKSGSLGVRRLAAMGGGIVPVPEPSVAANLLPAVLAMRLRRRRVR